MFFDWKKLFRRWSQSKGFGVQSPFAYHFIRGVIEEKEMYYAYSTLATERKVTLQNESLNDEKADRLLLRLSNFYQPNIIMVPDEGFALSRQYLVQGCRKAHILTYRDTEDLITQLNSRSSPIDLLYINLSAALVFESIQPRLSEPSLLIVAGITSTAESRQQWKVITDNSEGLTFDLGSLGIVMNNRHGNDKHYYVTF